MDFGDIFVENSIAVDRRALKEGAEGMRCVGCTSGSVVQIKDDRAQSGSDIRTNHYLDKLADVRAICVIMEFVDPNSAFAAELLASVDRTLGVDT